MTRLPQFRLRTLFAVTAVVALLLGLGRILGDRLGLGLIGLELVLPFAWRPRWLYAWFLPVLWTTVAWNSFYHPGDEYGFFFVGSAAGLWIMPVVGSVGSVHRGAAFVVAAGAASVAIVGGFLDKLRAPLYPWAFLTLVTAAGLFARTFGSFPTAERALAKNGSYEAYILASLNLGITFAALATLAGTGLYRLARRLRRTPMPGEAR
ncbi:MAG TPA: hypothetical protein VG826_06915 [Pirellulales bacterium]|nr:hypothetical protein [Pirellulales bacterium]